jgi:hypothetical protein
MADVVDLSYTDDEREDPDEAWFRWVVEVERCVSCGMVVITFR